MNWFQWMWMAEQNSRLEKIEDKLGIERRDNTLLVLAILAVPILAWMLMNPRCPNQDAVDRQNRQTRNEPEPVRHSWWYGD